MIGDDFGGIRVGKRKKMATAVNGNGVQEKITYLSYTVFNPRVMPFHLPEILGRRAHTPQTVVFTALRSIIVYAPLRCHCMCLFVANVRGPTLTHLFTGATQLFA